VEGFSALTGRVSWKANDEPTVAETMAAQNTIEIQRARIEGDKIDCAIISIPFVEGGARSKAQVIPGISNLESPDEAVEL
jgi:hypothetical protein